MIKNSSQWLIAHYQKQMTIKQLIKTCKKLNFYGDIYY